MVLRWPCWLVLALIVSCGGSQRARNANEEYLADIKISGNASYDTDELIAGSALYRAKKEGRPLDPYELVVDTARITAAYQKIGFFTVAVTSQVKTVGKAQVALFTIVEGKRAKVTVVIHGLPADVPLGVARDLVNLADGAPFNYEKFDEAKQPLLTLVENAGYAHAQMDAEVLADGANAQATLRFVFDAGPPCKFGAIELAGVDGPLAAAIRSRLAFREGEPYSKLALADTQRSIYELGRFSSARVEPDLGGIDIIPVKIAVALANRYESKIGGGFGYEPLTLEARARATITAAGLPGPLWNASLDFRPAYTVNHDFENAQPKIRLLGALQRMDLFRPFVTGELEGGLDYLTVEAYTSASARARLGLSAPLGYRWLRLRVGWILEQLTFSKINPAIDEALQAELGLDRNLRIGAFQQSLVADLRDDPISPHRGVYLELRVVEGTKYAGGVPKFLQVTPEIRGYIPLGRSVIALRTRIGAIFGDVPVTERYFTGGASSQRGFSERRLSPASMGIPYGGVAAMESGIELRSPIGKAWGLQLGGVAFLDGGDVTLKTDELDASNLHWATGLGLRIEVIKSVVVRVDLGYRLNRYGAGEPQATSGIFDRLALHLGVGEAY